ncbi:MAG: glutamate-5-semialdehyde dehydrogenase [Candidatus Omnitrophica bacterium]|nr:glutamate-5-semialdehyde dehydrogenase [Candidatus Omnitrophota bacterium]
MSAYIKDLVTKAKKSSFALARLSTLEKNRALKVMARDIIKNKDYILKENLKDLKIAYKNKLKQSFIDRLKLTDKRIKEMSKSLSAVAKLVDPVGKVISATTRPNGIRIKRVRVPIGVVLIVYEARPNVTSDCVGLLFKTSNVGILRGGSGALYSNKAIARVLNRALKRSGISFPAFFVVERTQRNLIDELLKQDTYIDLVIPRGGESLIRKVAKSSAIPVIKHYKGVCHIFVDKEADIKKALNISINAKTQRPSVCNAVETILVHQDIARKFLPLLKKEFDKRGVEIRGDKKTFAVIPGINQAKEADWAIEYLDLIVSIKIVKDITEAITHINTYGSFHTDSIITKSRKNIEKFLKEVDSACCFSNISTRFSDGFQFGLGAEIGISTDKLHARGPMGLEELTTYKWVATGNGQIRK